MKTEVRSAQIRRFAAAVLCLGSILAGMSLFRIVPVEAQEQAKQKTDAVAVVSDLDDIERLRVINPLQLQPDQIDKLVAALTNAQADYDKKVNALGASIFVASASEVHEVRKRALAGVAIPRDFDDRMKKLQADFLKQRDDLNTANIKIVAAACRGILSTKQISIATKMERDQYEKDHPDIKTATDAQLFNLYCVDVFISNLRSIPLLRDVRAAAK